MLQISVFSHYRGLLTEQAEGYSTRLNELASQIFSAEAWGKLAAQTAIRAGTVSDPSSVHDALLALSQSQMDQIAAEELSRLVSLKKPETTFVECHLFPCLNQEHRGGFSFAPGKMLILIPLIELWEKRLVRNITHEYSHTLRMTKWPLDERHGFGPAFRYTIREHLVFEGLAENLVEHLYPDPNFPIQQVTTAEEERFWKAIHPHLDKENWEAYGILMNPAAGLPRRIGYNVGYRIVQSYLQRQKISAVDAHQMPYDELYWNSGYELLQ